MIDNLYQGIISRMIACFTEEYYFKDDSLIANYSVMGYGLKVVLIRKLSIL
ncbi:hypothetical protein AALK94_04415 [Bacteroides faecichinchillae]|mgnify:CR=1 FL=1|uniref:Uncharacterized protein n=1 Tax=Bacteroides faecichinchillae TaxID=871325 RepID=A0A1M4VA83_9BACE|nr:hypothetical protein [Bacteroides faecichinchillae]SHE65864.1 hypothetical protein SAMN05444349_104151 [Bacteroides faecichinchillae]